MYRIGSLRHSNAKIYTIKPLKWSDGDIEMLGVTITNAPHQSNKAFDLTIDKMQCVTNQWSSRNLTMMGKILIVNTLMCSLFTYQMSVLPCMCKNQYDRIDNIIKEYLWNGGKPKIPLKVLQNSTKYGRLKLANFRQKHISLHMQWVQ